MKLRICLVVFQVTLQLCNIPVHAEPLERQSRNFYEFAVAKRQENESPFEDDNESLLKREANDDKDLKEITVQSAYAYQSSTSDYGDPSKALEGNCKLYGYSETRHEYRPMWYVDMDKEHHVIKVNIGLQFSRHAQRFREAFLKSLVDSPSFGHRNLDKACGHFRGPGKPNQIISLYCGAAGRYVVVILNRNVILEMCKVKIYAAPDGSNEKRIELNPRLAKQIATWVGRKASRAITGTCGTNDYSETSWASYPIWYIDLQNRHRVTKVSIGVPQSKLVAPRFRTVIIDMHDIKPSFNMGIRSVYTDGCGYFEGPATIGQVVTMYCGKTGRFFSVKIENSGNFYSSIGMCRMQIFAIDNPIVTTAAATTTPSVSTRSSGQSADAVGAGVATGNADDSGISDESGGNESGGSESISEPESGDEHEEVEAMSFGIILKGSTLVLYAFLLLWRLNIL